jgi:hypothetical protein
MPSPEMPLLSEYRHGFPAFAIFSYGFRHRASPEWSWRLWLESLLILWFRQVRPKGFMACLQQAPHGQGWVRSFGRDRANCTVWHEAPPFGRCSCRNLFLDSCRKNMNTGVRLSRMAKLYYNTRWLYFAKFVCFARFLTYIFFLSPFLYCFSGDFAESHAFGPLSGIGEKICWLFSFRLPFSTRSWEKRLCFA